MCRMRWMLALLLLIGCGQENREVNGVGDGEANPIGDGGVARPSEGQSCSLASGILWRVARSIATEDDCRSDAFTFASSDKICHCRAGKVVCAEPKAACTAGWLPNASCTGEGSGGCDEPVAVYCDCTDGKWSCSTPGCPDGCPRYSVPENGDSCSVPSASRCRYEMTTCTCTDGTFSCN